MSTTHSRRHDPSQEPGDAPPPIRGGQTIDLPGDLVARAYEGALFIETRSGTGGVQLSILLSTAYARDLRDFIDKHYGDTEP